MIVIILVFFFVICCDEIIDVSIKEQMFICIRFVEDLYIREEFIGFVELIKIDVEIILQSILFCMNSGDWIL